MKILIAWELGANYGHLLRQLPIALNLRARGHDVLFAVKDVGLAKETLTAEDISFVQAPVPRSRKKLDREIASFADILFLHGFDEQDVLHSLILAWQHLYRLHDTDVVIIEHAPAALLAARLSGIPTANVLLGFDLPPPVSPYPCFRPWLGLPESVLLQTEASILSNINALCLAQRRPCFAKLFEFMTSDAELLCTFPETDHYHERIDGRYIGPLITADAGLSVEWPTGHAKHVFVYVRPSAALASILNALHQIPANIICVIPGIDANLKKKMETPALHIYAAPLKLDALLQRCDLVITSSGHGMVSACLLAGIPMLVIPTQIEQLMLSNCVMRMGTGLALSLNDASANCLPALNRLLADPGFGVRAKAIADKYKGHDQNKLVGHIVDTIERLPAGANAKLRDRSGSIDPPESFARKSSASTAGSQDRKKEIALITGAGRGIGAAIAKLLANEGLTVVVNYKQDHEAAQEVIDHINQRGGTAIAMQADVSNPSQLSAMFAGIQERFGRLDVLVNNAGIAAIIPLEKIEAAQIHHLAAVNVQTVLLACKEAAALFTGSGGRIINISSIASHAGPAGSSLYAATKAAVEAITKTLAIELGGRNITVNAIAPGQIDTALYRKLSNANFDHYVLARTPLKRLGRPQDVASAVAFFASERAEWITGQVLRVDGGFSY